MSIRSLCTRSRLGALLCALGAVCAVVGASLIFPPAGFVVAAAELLFAGYALLYMEARNASARQSAAPK